MPEEWNAKEFGQNIYRSMLAGFAPTDRLLPNVIRAIIFIGFIAIFAVVNIKKWQLWHYFVFAGSIAIFIFLIQITLYILNKLLDESFELSTSSIEDIGEIEKPEGISKDLWNLRGAYKFDLKNISDTSFELIQLGFPPNEVLLLVEEMKKTTLNINKTTAKKAKPSESQGYLSIFGRLIEFRLSRKIINSVFPQNQSLITIFCGTILAFTTAFTASYSFNYIKSYLWIFFGAGISLYSILQYPDVDPYSHIKANPSTGLSRPLFVTLMCTILILAEKIIDWVGPKIEFTDFDVTVNWEEVTSHLVSAVMYAVGLIWIWIFGFIGPAGSSLTWILEFLSRYGFGLSGSAGFFNSIIQFLRSLIVCIGIYFVQKECSFNFKEPTILCISSFLLQIPLNYSSTTPKDILIVFGQIILYSFYYFLISYLLSAYNMNHNAIFITCIVLHTVGNIGLSSIRVFTRYIAFTCQFFKKSKKGFSYFRFILNLIITPLFISTVLRSSCSNFLYALVIVSGINRSISDSIGFSQGLLGFVFLYYEIQMKSIPAAFFLGIAISKKLFNMFDATVLYKIGRAFVMELIFDDDDLHFISGVVSWVLPFVDRGPFSFIGYTWSAISGSPVHSPLGVTLLQLPMPPRPNCFWQCYSETKLDIMKTIENNITTYPQEAPIYTSIVKALSSKLGTIIMEGLLGRVTENTFYIFYGVKMSFFLHIIALEPYVVRFQIRGLEYKMETYCHEVELRQLNDSMQDISSSFKDSPFEAFSYQWNHNTDLWSPIRKKLPLVSYDIASSELSLVLATCDAANIRKWAMWALANSLSKNPRVLTMVPNDANLRENSSDIVEYLQYMDVTLPDNSNAAAALFSAFEASLIADRSQLIDRIYLAFSGFPLLEEQDMWVETTDEAISDVFIDASRLLLLLIYLNNASLAPDLDDPSDVKEFLDTYQDTYFVGPAKSDEFAVEYIKEEKTLICLEKTQGMKMILYLHMSEAVWKVYSVNAAHVRSMWASQAMEQTFFAYADDERLSIQSTGTHLHNLINQAADMPIGYPALVSPICTSFVNFQ